MLNPLRHLSVFMPTQFGQKRVDVIGAGATGCRVVQELKKLGVENVHVWDFDIVEDHNRANQLYGAEHVGLAKVEALQDIVRRQAESDITIHSERHSGTQPLGEVVFLLTDTMDSRKQIWEGAIKFKPHTSLMIETRMGPDCGRIYTINPYSPRHIKSWEATLYTTQEADVSACGASTSVGATAEVVAGIAVWQMLRWFAINTGADDVLDNEIIFSLRPMHMLTQRF